MSPISSTLAEELNSRYVLEGELGRGGMATVYQAHDCKHDRTVALKVLHEDLAASLGPERFKQEIRIAARLQHPHILSVFDSGETANRLWFTMPYVSGESLRDRLNREGPLPVELAVTIVREAAQALAYAHRQGVIHRDIKPENILLTEDGATLVADFGIARAQVSAPGSGTMVSGLTRTGSTIGTPAYMAPEQATGERGVSDSVDQYALAAVLYELLTGVPPFCGANLAALIAARYTTPVTPIRERRPEVPAEVDLAVQRALSLNPADRFASIGDFARAVAPSLTTPPRVETVPIPGRRPPRRSWTIAAGSVALAALATSGFFMVRSARRPAGPIRIVVLPFQNLGDSADRYIADGMVDELRGKLLHLPGVEVIARASSVQYAGTTKSPAEIARELEVRYLLAGTVRVERKPDGRNVVHLRPELMQVGRGDAATSRWQQSFDQPITDGNAVQGSIAQEVASQLQVALATGEVVRLKQSPTTSPAAYDAYLRGMNQVDDVTPANLRRRIADLTRAVTLDSRFAEAWAQLVLTASYLYVTGRPEPGRDAAIRAMAEQARAAAPGSTADHLAWSSYYYSVAADFPRAEREMQALRAAEPNNAYAAIQLARLMANQGRFAEALPLFDTGTRLDPLNARVWGFYADALHLARRYPEAVRAAHRAAVLSPAASRYVLSEIGSLLGLGDLEGAHAVIRRAYASIPAEKLDVYLAVYWDYAWILSDPAQRRVLAAPLQAFDGDEANQAVVQAQIYQAQGDSSRTRTAAQRAYDAFGVQLQNTPNDVQLRVFRAFAAVLAGRSADARRVVAEADSAVRAQPLTTTSRSYFLDVIARVYVLNGDHEQALEALESLMAEPGLLTVGNLRYNPIWASLRGEPRFERLLQPPARSDS